MKRPVSVSDTTVIEYGLKYQDKKVNMIFTV